MTRHWTLDELMDRLYGIREADEHLASCRECGLRIEDLQRRRAASVVSPELTAGEWACRKAAVLERIESPSRRIPSWVPAMTAAACLAVIALLTQHSTLLPARVTPPAADSAVAGATPVSDAQLFADIYSVEESDEPRAAAPIHELFQEEQQ